MLGYAAAPGPEGDVSERAGSPKDGDPGLIRTGYGFIRRS